MTLDEVLKVMEMQEEILQFSHFTNADAWELGNLLVAEANKRHMPIAVSIRLNNGYVVFQYGFNGTGLCNGKWLQQKENTVKHTEKSTLHMYMLIKKQEGTLQDWGMDEINYTLSGGGFPIRVEEVGVVGSVVVSGVDSIADHDLIIKCVSRYLHVDEVPRLRAGLF